MSCPACHTYCPLCRLPLSPGDIAAAPADQYPTHYACRVAQQEWMEEQELLWQEREYRRAEDSRRR